MNTAQPLATDPVILISAARSGSKFLRDTLAASVDIDAVPYDVNYVWRYGQEDCSDDCLNPALLQQAHINFIHKQLSRLAQLGPGNVLLEKTVSNSMRVPFVRAVYPNARFIHLVRDGRDVAISANKQWTASADFPRLLQKLRGLPINNVRYLGWALKNQLLRKQRARIWGPRYPGIDEDRARLTLDQICAKQWQASYATATHDLLDAPKDRVFEIRYEDLLQSNAPLRALIEKFDLPDRGSILQTYKDRIHHWKQSAWSQTSPATRAEIEQIIHPNLQQLGYLS